MSIKNTKVFCFFLVCPSLLSPRFSLHFLLTSTKGQCALEQRDSIGRFQAHPLFLVVGLGGGFKTFGLEWTFFLYYYYFFLRGVGSLVFALGWVSPECTRKGSSMDAIWMCLWIILGLSEANGRSRFLSGFDFT